MKGLAWGFGWGAGSGVVLTLVALLVMEPLAVMVSREASVLSPQQWLTSNLGHSVWLFAIVVVVYTLNLNRLHRLLDGAPSAREVGELDQLSDVWIQLFVGIGVIWTAVGMRSALQAALGAPGEALTDTAGNVLQKLVDGGILLALTTTIVGGVGGYLMRLVKTMMLGAALHEFYDRQNRKEVMALVEAVTRIEARMDSAYPRSVDPAASADQPPVPAVDSDLRRGG
jgi:hypothetical protein